MTLSASTLSETKIEVSDQHSAVGQFGARRSGLPLTTQAQYCNLHKTIAGTPWQHVGYAQVKGAGASVFDELFLGYVRHKFWGRIVRAAFQEYPEHAWDGLLPLMASLAQRVTFAGLPRWTFGISPKPRVLIYPFGWSTWLSLRITGDHTFSQLTEVVDQLFNHPCMDVSGAAAPLTLDEFFDLIAGAVRTEVFAGPRTADVKEEEPLMVMTVLAKHGPSPSLNALTPAEQSTMLGLVRPTQRPPGSPFANRVRPLIENDPLQYALVEDRKHFMWVQSLLRPEGRNRQHLLCYHSNTFRSLERAGHLHALIDRVAAGKSTAASFELAQSAAAELRSPKYRGRLALDYVQGDPVKSSLANFATLKPPRAKRQHP